MSNKLDSLLKGLTVFKEGMQQFATAKAITEAKKELDTARLTFAQAEGLSPDQVGIDTSAFDDRKNQIAQDLSMRLAQTGASATQISAATGFGLTAAQTAEKEKTQLTALGKTLDSQIKTQEAKVKESRKLAIDAPDKFFASNTPKNLVSGITSADNIIGQLEARPGDRAVVELAKSTVIKMVEGGKVTDADVERMKKDPAYWAQMVRRLGIEMTNSISENESAYYKELLEKTRDTSVSQLRDLTKAQVEGIKAAVPDLEVDRVESAFNERIKPFKLSAEIRQEKALKATEKLVDDQIKAGKIKPENRADALNFFTQQQKSLSLK